jgi:hypothetical protein
MEKIKKELKPMTIIRKELNKFLGSNRVNTKHLYAKNKKFQLDFEFPVSGRTVYRIIKLRKNATLKNQKKILKRLGIEFEEIFNGIEIINYGE